MSFVAYALSTALLVWLLVRRGALSRAAAIAIVLLPLGLTGRAMLTGAIYGPVDLAYATEPLASIADEAGVTHVANPGVSDVYAQFMPWNDALRRAVRDGEWPLWTRFEATGTPLAGALQSAPYHPVTLIGLLIPAEDAITFTAAMTFFLAALSMFLFLRALALTEIAAMFGAAAVMLSTHLVWYAGTALALAAAVAPLALLGTRRVVHAPNKQSAAILGTALLLIVIAGHPESALHLVSLAIVYFAFEFARVRPQQWRAVIACGLGAGVGALLVSAVFLLPFFAEVRQTAEHRHRELTFEGRQNAAGAAEVAHRLAANVMPFFEGMPGVEEREHAPTVRHGWLASAYAGSLLFAPALFALLRVRDPQKWFFALIALVGIGVGVSAPGFTDLLNVLPGFQFAVNDRMIFYAVIGIATLAAMGIDSCVIPSGVEGSGRVVRDARPTRPDPSLTLGMTSVLIATAMLVVAISVDTDLSPTWFRINAARAILPLFLGAAAFAVMRAPRAALALIALLLVQRIGEAGDLQPTIPRRAFYPPFPGVELMRHAEPFRIVGVGVTLPPVTSTHYGLEDARAFEALTLGRYYDGARLWSVEQPVWFNRVDSLESPFLSLMNVRFAIAPAGFAAPPWWKTKGDFGAYSILENTRVLPRAFVPRRVFHRDRDHNLETELKLTSDFADVAFIESGTPRAEAAPNGPGVVHTRAEGSRVRIQASMQNAAWVVISNSAWKGWRARVDGRATPVFFANRAFLAVQVPAGEHEIELFYRPVEFVIGAWISGIALLLIAYTWRPRTPITFFMSAHTSFFAAGFRSR